jgi:ribosomal protein S12 methylthiotransferase accessory factor
MMEVDLLNFSKIFDGDFGIINEIKSNDLKLSRKKMYFTSARSANMSVLFNSGVTHAYGHSVDFLKESSIISAVGETLERYSSFYLPKTSFFLEKYCDLGEGKPELRDLNVFLPSQFLKEFSLLPFSDVEQHFWVEATGLRNEKVLVPAQMIYMRKSTSLNGESKCYYATSSGFAIHTEKNLAQLGAALELIERDQFMTSWYTNEQLTQIDWESDAEMTRIYEDYFLNEDFVIRSYKVNHDINIPVIISIITKTTGEIAVGSAADISYRNALVKSWKESFQTFLWANNQNRDNFYAGSDLYKIKNFDDHIMYYYNSENSRLITETLENSKSVSLNFIEKTEIFSQKSENLVEKIDEYLKELNFPVYFIDVTAPDIKSLGFHCYKAFSYDLQPVDVGYRTRLLGTRRLEKLLFGKEANLMLHPFP